MMNHIWEAMFLAFLGGAIFALCGSEFFKYLRLRNFEDLFIETFTGKKIYARNPDINLICIEDIAHALSNNCRYNGHVGKFYSVAEHSVKLALYVLNVLKLGPRAALQMLMHDAPETYVTDMPKPFKVELLDYQRIEKRFEKIVFEAFGLPVELPQWIKDLDHNIIKDERLQLMSVNDNVWPFGIDDKEPLGIILEKWMPERAEQEFLNLYYTLKQKIAAENLI